MVELKRGDILRELDACKDRQKLHEVSALINKIVIKAFEKELKKYPDNEPKSRSVAKRDP